MTRQCISQDRRPGGPIVLDKREATIVRALIRDGTVASAAQALGLSTRHIRRLLRTLETRLDVGNTHALVAVVVAAGLVAPPSPDGLSGHRVSGLADNPDSNATNGTNRT